MWVEDIPLFKNNDSVIAESATKKDLNSRIKALIDRTQYLKDLIVGGGQSLRSSRMCFILDFFIITL